MSLSYVPLTQPLDKQGTYSQGGEHVLDVQFALMGKKKIIALKVKYYTRDE